MLHLPICSHGTLFYFNVAPHTQSRHLLSCIPETLDFCASLQLPSPLFGDPLKQVSVALGEYFVQSAPLALLQSPHTIVFQSCTTYTHFNALVEPLASIPLRNQALASLYSRNSHFLCIPSTFPSLLFGDSLKQVSVALSGYVVRLLPF